VGLLRDANRQAALATAARRLVVEHYDWSAVAGALEEALQVIAECGVRSADDSAISPSHTRSQSALRTPHSAIPTRFSS
jgi:hypothetical protein